MNPRLKKTLLLALIGVLLMVASQVQRTLSREREALGLTRTAVLDNAPPVLAFTTVALGGFRGLIANALWIRASELQDEDKVFEAKQLSDWITKLEPHFSMVWTHLAWNMAYNISVKFKETPSDDPNAPLQYPDRWRWVKAGIELLRDEGLKYNPNDVGIHQQLGWIFQHKMGANLDDANVYYKQQWVDATAEVFGRGKQPNLDGLVDPQTEEDRARADMLRNKFKMDPAFVVEVDKRYGPLEWRFPEASAIYWAAEGLRKAEEHPTKVKQEDLIQLRRVIYQSMQLAVRRGKLVWNPYNPIGFSFGPNLDIIPKANAAYEQAMEEDVENRDHIARAHRNLLRDFVYFLFVNARTADAAQWFKYLGEKYPDKPILDYDPTSLPATLTMQDYAIGRVVGDITETDRDRIQGHIEGFLAQAYRSMILGDDEEAEGYVEFAKRIHEKYELATQGTADRIKLDSIPDLQRKVLNFLIGPDSIWPSEVREKLREMLNLGPAPSAAQTNSAPAL